MAGDPGDSVIGERDVLALRHIRAVTGYRYRGYTGDSSCVSEIEIAKS